MLDPVHIIAARRSAVVPKGGAFKELSLHELTSPVIDACLKDANLTKTDISELVLSNALYGGGNPARVCALAAGFPNTVAGLSIDRQCVGGLDAILLAADMIRSGRADVIIAGGGETASLRPLRFHAPQGGQEAQQYDAPPFTPWPDRDPSMHVAADALAKQLDITKDDQDAWAINSHAKATLAKSKLNNEIVPINSIENDTYTRNLSKRICERAQTITGCITSATTAVSADAAAFLVLVSQKKYRQLGQPKSIKLYSGITLGDDPTLPGIAPVAAINRCLKQADVLPTQLTHIEIMEAYAAQSIACVNKTQLPVSITNQKGGALARGHPIGASGAILAVRLFHDLMNEGGIGLATIAAAGGLGTAVILNA